MGQSKAQKQFNRDMAANAREQTRMQREMFELTKAGTPEQQRYRAEAADWQKFIESKDYGKPPKNSILNFDLWTPAQLAKQKAQMDNLTGIGAANMGGSGDQSLALSLSRERNNNLLSQMQGQSYENAIKGLDQYYKTGSLGWANLGTQANLGLLSNATQSAQFFYDQQRQTLPPGLMATLAPILGGAFQMGSAFLGNPAAFGGAAAGARGGAG